MEVKTTQDPHRPAGRGNTPAARPIAAGRRGRVSATLQGGMAMAAHLRVYPSMHESHAEAQEPTVRISLRDMLPLVALAQRRNYLWLHDFLDDEVSITSDLYEVLRAFRSHRPSA